MSESPIETVAEIYRNMASEMVKSAVKITDGDYHLAYALLNSATERLRSRNHVMFSVTMVDDMKNAAAAEEAKEQPEDNNQAATTNGPNHE